MFEDRVLNEVRSVGVVDEFDHSEDLSHSINPLNSESLNFLINSVTEDKPRKVVLVVTDRSRPTPIKELLTNIIPKLRDAGINTYVVVANGTHEIELSEVSEIAGGLNVRVYINEPDSNQHLYVGTTKGGVPIKLLDKVVDADTIILLGSVIPHVWAGFSGGSKLLLPGVSARESIIEHHLKYYNHPNALPGITEENPFREEIDYVGDLISSNANVYAVNVIHGKSSIYFTAGRLKESYLRAIRMAESTYVKEVNGKYDVLVVDGRPLNMSLYQSIKAVFNNLSISNNDSSIILISRSLGKCPKEFLEALESDDVLVDKLIHKGVKDLIPYLVAYSLREKLRYRSLAVLTNDSITYHRFGPLTITNKYDFVVEEIKKRYKAGSKICIIRDGAKYININRKH